MVGIGRILGKFAEKGGVIGGCALGVPGMVAGGSAASVSLFLLRQDNIVPLIVRVPVSSKSCVKYTSAPAHCGRGYFSLGGILYMRKKKPISNCPKCKSVCLWFKPDKTILCQVCMILMDEEGKPCLNQTPKESGS